MDRSELSKTKYYTAEGKEKAIFNALTGTLYTAEGLVVKVSADAVIGKDSITVTVTSNESENYKAAEAEITLKVEMPPDLTQELADAQSALEKAIANGDTAPDGKITDLNTALDNAKAALESTDAENKEALEKAISDGDTALQSAIDTVSKNLADAQAALDKAIADGDEAIKEAQKNLNDLEAALEKAATDNKAALEAKDRELQTFIIIVCVISGVAFCGCGTLGVFYFLDKRKKPKNKGPRRHSRMKAP